MRKRKYIRGTQATYVNEDDKTVCDVVELAMAYSNVENVPEKVGFNRAAEISLLARSFLTIYNRFKDQLTEE